MVENLKKFKYMERGVFVFLAVTLLCTASIAAFLNYYINAYQNPYLKRDVFDLSENWQYQTGQTGLTTLSSLRNGPYLQGGETMTLYRTLDIELSEAAIMIRANHQAVNVYLDDVPLFLDKTYASEQNPGMALHFILLPDNYLHKTLKIELTSPFSLYSGRTAPIFLGTIPSLEAHTLSLSMRSLILMAMCLALGFFVIAFSFMQALSGSVHKEQLAIGVFAVIWALYYVCTEYIMYQFFAPMQMSILSLGLYFSFQVPLVSFFYFSFEHYKKWLLPAVVLHYCFVTVAFALQLSGILDMPHLINVNNIFLVGLIYTAVLAVLEAIKKNRMMMLAAPFLIVAYVSMLYNFYVFYTRSGVVPYSYRDTYFLLILAVLIYNVFRFFKRVYQDKREMERLSLQKRFAHESFEQIKNHLHEVSGLKHEVRNHLTALKAYLEDGRAEEARNYLNKYVKQAAVVTETMYIDNFLLNVIVGDLLQRAETSGIKVDLNIRAIPVRIDDLDMYSLLSNILDNALEACMAMPPGYERFIRLTITRREPYLNIRCENSKTGIIVITGGKIQTTKTGAGHGYGLWIIGRIVDAYDGILSIDHDENSFTIMMGLKD